MTTVTDYDKTIDFRKNTLDALIAMSRPELESCEQNGVILDGQHLNPHDEDDAYILSAFVRDSGDLVKQLNQVKQTIDDVLALRHASAPCQMTDAQALSEIEEAKRVLDKHYDVGFLLGIWNTCDEGIQYHYADGSYAELAERDSEDQAA